MRQCVLKIPQFFKVLEIIAHLTAADIQLHCYNEGEWNLHIIFIVPRAWIIIDDIIGFN